MCKCCCLQLYHLICFLFHKYTYTQMTNVCSRFLYSFVVLIVVYYLCSSIWNSGAFERSLLMNFLKVAFVTF
uniref:Uncharacterized protein n=1 Tax=Arundo donax TaxID=35708 RepID=A0A0A9CSQ7_ARUDO